VSPYIGPSYHDDERDWRESLERQRSGMSPYRELEESQESERSQRLEKSERGSPSDKAEAGRRREVKRGETSQERSEEESQEALEVRTTAAAWEALRRSRYLGSGYGEEEEKELLEIRAATLSPFIEMRPLTRPKVSLRNAELLNSKSPGRKTRSHTRKRTHISKPEKVQKLIEASARSKADNGTVGNEGDELLSVDPQVLEGLAECFQRNGYVKWRDGVSEAEVGGGMRHGIELRLAANSDEELEEVRKLLKSAGFSPGRPFRKGHGYRQPLYGPNAMRFVELLRIQGREIRTAERRPRGV